MRSADHRTRTRRSPPLLPVLLATAVASVLLPGRASASNLPGSQGLDTSLTDTNSAAHVSGGAAFPNLRIDVNQTKNLTDQAISITWTGGKPTDGGVDFAGNFLQIFECWGKDDGSNPANPGPSPDGCEFGYGGRSLDSSGIYVGLQKGGVGTDSNDRVIKVIPGGTTPSATDLQSGYFQPFDVSDQSAGGVIWKPFRAADGRVVNVSRRPTDNTFFDPNTTNEIDYGLTRQNGTGSELFNLYTGKQAPGLGCAQQVDIVNPPNGGQVTPTCWLVIVPRASALEENPFNTQFVSTSPLAPVAWAHRIAIPLDFNATDTACPSGASQRIVAGSELASIAVNNWKPVLCGQPGSPPYAFQSVGDPVARQQVISGSAPVAVTSQPLDPSMVDPSTPAVYAPITLSGMTIAFNLDRDPLGITQGNKAPPDVVADRTAEQPFAGIRVADINMTPRLVAKLLTQSYLGQFYDGILSFPSKPPAGYQWAQHNPFDLLADQDFLQYNPEFNLLKDTQGTRTTAAAIVESRLSDSSNLVWHWILADPEAKAWLGGAPDNNTPPMKVNPYFSTDPAVNKSGAFGTPVPENFPRNDPYCYVDPALVGIPPTPPMPVAPRCSGDVTPYALDQATAARETRAGNDKAKTFRPSQDQWLQVTPDQYWTGGGEAQGRQEMVSVVDTASAARYGLQMASLSRAGDDGPQRTFVAPDQGGMLAGAKAMVPDSTVPEVRESNPSAAAGAYPLTMVTYAETLPGALDPSARTDYARFVSFAAGAGQTIGFDYGNLLPGYAPLPQDLRAQASAAAAVILKGGGTVAGTVPPVVQPKVTTAPMAPVVGGLGSRQTSGQLPTAPATAANPSQTTPPTVSIIVQPSNKAGPVLRTLGAAVGLIRYTLPVVLIVGIGVTAWLLETRRRRKSPSVGNPDGW